MSGQVQECSVPYSAIKTPKGCLWQKIAREHQDTFSHSVCSDCNWTGMAQAPNKSQPFSFVKKRKDKCERGRAVQIIIFSSTVRILALLSDFQPGKERLETKDPAPYSGGVHMAVLEHCSSLQLSLPEPLFGLVCKLRQESLLWLPSRNSEVAERECKEGTVQLYHIYLITFMKHQNCTPECLKQKVNFWVEKSDVSSIFL